MSLNLLIGLGLSRPVEPLRSCRKKCDICHITHDRFQWATAAHRPHEWWAAEEPFFRVSCQQHKIVCSWVDGLWALQVVSCIKSLGPLCTRLLKGACQLPWSFRKQKMSSKFSGWELACFDDTKILCMELLLCCCAQRVTQTLHISRVPPALHVVWEFLKLVISAVFVRNELHVLAQLPHFHSWTHTFIFLENSSTILSCKADKTNHHWQTSAWWCLLDKFAFSDGLSVLCLWTSIWLQGKLFRKVVPWHRHPLASKLFSPFDSQGSLALFAGLLPLLLCLGISTASLKSNTLSFF